MELQEIAAGPGGEHLAPGRPIEHRGDQPVVVDLDAEVLILEVARSSLDRRSVGVGLGGHQVVDPEPAGRHGGPEQGAAVRKPLDRPGGAARVTSRVQPGRHLRRDQAGAEVGERVPHHDRMVAAAGVGPTGQLGQGTLGDALGLTDDLGVVTSGVLVHPVDARSGMMSWNWWRSSVRQAASSCSAG